MRHVIAALLHLKQERLTDGSLFNPYTGPPFLHDCQDDSRISEARFYLYSLTYIEGRLLVRAVTQCYIASTERAWIHARGSYKVGAFGPASAVTTNLTREATHNFLWSG